jgi:tetratricopeptide (TPR) repeat protein
VPDLARPRRWIDCAGIFAAALAVRLVCLWQLWTMPFQSHLVGDSKVYWEWAGRIAAGDWLGEEAFYQAPLYPYFLALVRTLLGQRLLVVYLLQAALGALGCVLLTIAARSLYSRAAALCAGLMLAVYPPAIFADLQVQKESLALFLVALLLLLLNRAQPRWMALGATLGLLVLTRENALVWVPLVALWLLSRRLLVAAALFGLGLCVTLGPVVARNHHVSGEWLLTTSQLGTNLYIGNGPEADGSYVPLLPGRGNARFERDDAKVLAERSEGRELTPGEISTHWRNLAFKQIAAQPGRWLRLMLKKVVYVANAYELPDTEDLYFGERWSWLLRALDSIWHFGVLLPLAAVGVLLIYERRSWILAALALSMAASVTAFFVVARYRLPLVPVLMLLAASALVEAVRLRRRKLGLAVCIAFGVALFANLPGYPRAPKDAMQLFNWGVVLEQGGQPDSAAEHYRDALQLAPALPEAHYNLGNLYRKAGRLQEAQASLEEAVRLRPVYSEAWNNLGLVLRDEADLHGAAQAIFRSLSQWPGNVPARRNLQLLRATAVKRGDVALANEIAEHEAKLP